ncbi:hypothetical protein HDU84_009144 [Entophlyctis sp. JEL0112]|nr:hypothetical protein HDU84_009144 [Entophlyctis sp. JEL0112]
MAANYPATLIEYISLPYPLAYKVSYLAATPEYGPILTSDLRFAQHHLDKELATAEQDIGEFLATNEIAGDAWMQLPLTYKTAIYARVLALAAGAAGVDRLYRSGLVTGSWPLTRGEAYGVVSSLLECGWADQTAVGTVASKRKDLLQALVVVAAVFGSADALRLIVSSSSGSAAGDASVPANAARKRNTLVAQWELQAALAKGIKDSNTAVDVSCGSSNIPLICAAEQGHGDAVEFLLQSPAVNPRVDSNYPLVSACARGHAAVVRLLVAHKLVDPNMRGVLTGAPVLPFVAAAGAGHLEVLKVLVEDPRVSAAADDNEAICVAAANGCFEVVRFLLAQNSVDPGAQSQRAVREAAKNGHVGTVKLLLKDARVDPAAANTDQ